MARVQIKPREEIWNPLVLSRESSGHSFALATHPLPPPRPSRMDQRLWAPEHISHPRATQNALAA